MLQAIDADAVRRWCAAGYEALERAREEIDRLNVYPVPDGDTGTNLMLTMQSVTQAVSAEGRDGGGDLTATLRAMARGALMGARGNSGVILSQLLRGLADVLSDTSTAGPDALQRALTHASDLAYAAVSDPVEGTVLTVARAAADSARSVHDDDLAAVVRAAAHGAAEALAHTPEQLEALARAGVVDAGGRGLVVLLDALVAVVTGESPQRPSPNGRHAEPADDPAPQAVVARDEGALVVARESGSAEFGYEVQYLLHAAPDAVERLKKRLARLGDSLVVVGHDGLWNVHVHVNDVGAAIEAGVDAGRPHRITVTRFEDQVNGVGTPPPAPARDEPGIVAVVPGEGLARLLEQEGATVVAGGPTTNPSTAELVEAVRATGSRHVVVFPNDANVRGVADAAAAVVREEGRTVAVIPTKSPVQCLAALAVHDPDRPTADDVIAMTAAAGATRWAEVTVAVRDAQTSAGVCRAGDVLGMLEGDVALIGPDVRGVATGLLDRMLIGGGELVTVVTGADAEAGLADHLVDYLAATRPSVEVSVYAGGQPHYPLLLGVE